MNLFQKKGMDITLAEQALGKVTISESAVLNLLTETLNVSVGITNVSIREFSSSAPGISYRAEIKLSPGSDREKSFSKARQLVKQVLDKSLGIPVFSQELKEASISK